MAYCNAKLKSGFDTIADIVELDKHLASADVVITGEGMFDAQTAMGKVASGVAKRAKQHNVPVIAICGAVDRPNELSAATTNDIKLASIDESPLLASLQFETDLFDIVVPSLQKLDSLEQVFANADRNVAHTAYQIATALKLGKNIAAIKSR